MKKAINVSTPVTKPDGYYVRMRLDADFCEGGSVVAQTFGPFGADELDDASELLGVLDGCIACGGEEAEDTVPGFAKWLTRAPRSHRLAVKLPRNYEAGGHADIVGYDVECWKGGIAYKCTVI